MNRVRPVEALLAALATLAVTLPLTTLFTPSTWLRPSVVLVAVVALGGMGLRRITSNRLPLSNRAFEPASFGVGNTPTTGQWQTTLYRMCF